MKSPGPLLLSCLLFTGCRERDNSIPARFDAIEAALTNALMHFDQLDKRTIELKRDQLDHSLRLLELEEGAVNMPREYQINPDLKAYVVTQSNLGPVLAVTESVTPYLDGYKINLRLGNPWTTTYDGITIHAQWGPPYSAFTNQPGPFSLWRKAQTMKEIAVTDTVHGSRWNNVEITLAPATPEDIRNCRLTFRFNELRLIEPKP